MKSLIVTADDFGLSGEVNAGILRAHRDGILTAASLMVAARASAEAVAIAKATPSLRVGLHLVLVDGRACLPAAKIPALVQARCDPAEGRSGAQEKVSEARFRTDLARAGAAMFFLPHVRAQLRAEIAAQFAAFAATGLAFDHVNAHKHFHMHPTIAGEIIAQARRHGVRWVRTPNEPSGVLRAIEPGLRLGAEARIAGPFAKALDWRMRRAGLRTPDRVFGLAWTGAMTAGRLTGLLAHLPDGVTEIYTHPATSDDFAYAASGYRYADELAALTDAGVLAAAAASGARMGGFGDVA